MNQHVSGPSRVLYLLATLCGISAVSCASDAGGISSTPGGDSPHASNASDLQSVTQDLGVGDHGPDVAAVYNYLRAYGYFPNAELETRFPYWSPIVESEPADPSTFGPELEQAVRVYQGYIGVPQSGFVDSKTLEFMKEPRCAHPENEFALRSSGEKFNLLDGDSRFPLWTKSSLTWKVTSGSAPAPYSAATVDSLITAAFNSWQSETFLNFSHTTGTPDIDIKWYSNTSVPSGWPSFNPNSAAGQAVSSSKIGLNSGWTASNGGTWSNDGDPNGLLQGVVVHEIGHTLGLAHTSISTSMGVDGISRSTGPIMFWNNRATALQIDDRSAITSRYTVWKGLSGFAVDVGANGTKPTNNTIWVTSGNNTIWKFNGSTFDADQSSDANGVSISVTSTGVPWVVTSTSRIKRRSSNNPATTGSQWGSQLGTGIDIGIGGGTADKVWIVGTTGGSNGNFDVLRWNGTATGTGSFVAPDSPIKGVRIAVSGSGLPIVLKADNTIWIGSSATGTSWSQMGPTSGRAKDVGAATWGGVYVIGTTASGSDFTIYQYDKQGASTPGLFNNIDTGDATAVDTYRLLDGAATRIAVGVDGRPIAVQSSGLIFQRAPRP